MPKNHVEQAPKIKVSGEKFLKEQTWGRAIRPHELETIFFNLIDSKNVAQLKLMLFLTGNAEGYKLIKEATIARLGVTVNPYYNARRALAEKGWISVEVKGDSTYIVVNYDKIYKDGKSILDGANKKEGICQNTSEESNCENTSDESVCEKDSVEESICEKYSDINEKGGISERHSEEGISQKDSDEGICEKDSQKESICEKDSVSICDNTSEGNSESYYNNINNNINNKIMDEIEESFGDWGENYPTVNEILTGPAKMF